MLKSHKYYLIYNDIISKIFVQNDGEVPPYILPEIREEVHNLTAYDWENFTKFVNRHYCHKQ